MALTATASPEVRKDILKSLHFENGEVLVTSFNRPNIRYAVEYIVADDVQAAKAEIILRHLAPSSSSGRWPCGIIYALKRADVDDLAEMLKKKGAPVAAYHAGVKNRAQVLEDFQSGKISIVVATVAFGMGIDKADVRYVIHYNMSKNISAFYQESGRAGRDGHPCHGIVLLAHEDLNLLSFLAQKEDEEKRNGAKAQAMDGDGRRQPSAESRFLEIKAWCCGTSCRRSTLLSHLGEQLGSCRMFSGNQLCDNCRKPTEVKSSLQKFQQSTPTNSNRSRSNINIPAEDPNDYILSRNELGHLRELPDPFENGSSPKKTKKRKRKDIEEATPGQALRARVDNGDISADEDDEPVVHVKTTPQDLTAENRDGVRSKLAKALTGKPTIADDKVPSLAAALEEHIFGESTNKTGYLGRARTVLSQINSADTFDTFFEQLDSDLKELLSTALGGNLHRGKNEDQGDQPHDTDAILHPSNGKLDDQQSLLRLSRIELLCEHLEDTLPPPSTDIDERGAWLDETLDAACDVLNTLAAIEVSQAMLQHSQVAARVRAYRKHPSERIQSSAAAVVSNWKAAVKRNVAA